MHKIEELTLHHGALEFSAVSMGQGPLVLCLHGFPDNADSFHEQMPALASAGYHVVSVAMRGYEPSSQPQDGDYSLAAIARDVISFLDQLEAKQAHLIGHDWGAAVAYVAAASAPERFKSLVTMAVPHSGRFLNEVIMYPKQLCLSWYMLFFKLPWVADFCLAWNNFWLLRRLWKNWSPGYTPPDKMMQGVIASFQQSGVVDSALSYYRQALSIKLFSPSARQAGRFHVPVPTMAMTGVNDGCIDSNVFKALCRSEDFPAGLDIRQIENAGHFLHQEQPQVVNELVLFWLNSKET